VVWEFRLVATGKDGEDEAVAGACKASPEEADRWFNFSKPPLPGFARSPVSLSFLRPDHRADESRYGRDLRPTAVRLIWEAVVETAPPGGEITLTWPEFNRTVPANVRVTLTDLDTGRAALLRTWSHYTYRAARGGGTRRFRLVAERTVSPGLTVTHLLVVPGKGAGQTFTYTLSAEAEVAVSIRSLAGRIIREVAVGAMQEAGTRTLPWDGRDGGGRPLPHGTYLVEVAATATDGQIARAVRTVSIR
jgi:hypothetical protein